jgi:glucosamine 6-phosphate synthetase-like amidotransferase/phosphosugar isomerase protein
MCGIFGFITKHGAGPDVARLKAIAVVTQRRGAHAFGLAWLKAGGRIETYKRPGAATACLDNLDRCRGAVAVIGHCRYATHGHPDDNGNNHPHRAGRGWLVHNGVVHNYRALVAGHRLTLATECDSEVLGRLMARRGGSTLHRAARTAALALGDLALLGLWRRPTRLLIVRREKPLHLAETQRGFYFGSLPEALPGRPVSLPDNYAGVLTLDASGLRLKARQLTFE